MTLRNWGNFLGVFLGLASWSEAAEQTLELTPGWNSIYLELKPEHSDPEVLFAGKPVEMVSLWLPDKAKVDSLVDPEALPERSPQWRTWQPASSPSAFLNNLRAIPARTPLLIKVTSACQVTVSGEPAFARTKWTGTSFNLVGFDIDSTAPPTFARFFDDSRAHEDLKVFRLIANRWQKVAPTDLMKRGVAYWVWSKEGSDFQGPVDITWVGESLSLSSQKQSATVRLRRNGSLPVTLTVEMGSGLAATFVGSGSQSSSLDLADSYQPLTLQLGEEGQSAGNYSFVLQGGGMQFRLPVSIY
ncbi:hypothetical protein [Roseibacillus persicicus]|uniref:Uncharacterized protein n=1 Tax=Roseibacillus persicicus TaxID=454148 RepID=A0A918TKB3_9BACT|nr:hypothetical protein [Roseibacillus persicicus]GHC49542.1 hypothetical protein GCM10007100_14380 [Roseibacillus persicicus]